MVGASPHTPAPAESRQQSHDTLRLGTMQRSAAGGWPPPLLLLRTSFSLCSCVLVLATDCISPRWRRRLVAQCGKRKRAPVGTRQVPACVYAGVRVRTCRRAHDGVMTS